MQQLLTPTTDPIGDSPAPGISTEEAQLMLASAQQLLDGSANANSTNSISTVLKTIDADIAALLAPHTMPRDNGRTRWVNPDNTPTGHFCVSEA